jgi:phospholipase/carboxylesterase
LLILLHGRGSDEHDLIPITHYLDGRFYLISVRAPFHFSYGGNTWFEIGKDEKPNDDQFLQSYEKLEKFITDATVHYDVASGPIYLFGFSMGAMMALAYSMMHPERIRGVAAHSGYLPPEGKLTYKWGGLTSVSVFLAHGTQDPIVPVERARATQNLITPTGAKLTYKEYAIQHQVSEESIADIDAWYKILLGPAPR